jgi:hypothetical protein
MEIGRYKQAMSHLLKDNPLQNITFNSEARLIDNDILKTVIEKAAPVINKTVGTYFSPAVTALSETGTLGKLEKGLTGTNYLEGSLSGQIKEGKSAEEIATDPTTYLPYALLSNASEHIANPAVARALNLGLSRGALSALGPAGWAATGVAGGYQLEEAIRKEYERLKELSPDQLEAENLGKQSESSYIPESAGSNND